MVEAKDAEIAMLRAELAAGRKLRRRMELRLAELERRLGQDSTNSGMPASKEGIGARERRKAERKKRDTSERERRLAGIPVSAGFVDKAASRLDSKLKGAGFDAAMRAALAAEPALGADETPVNVLAPVTRCADARSRSFMPDLSLTLET